MNPRGSGTHLRLAWNGLQITSDALHITWDALQITLDALQITLDGLQIRESILEGLLHLSPACTFVLRAVREHGTGGDVDALIGVPYRRLLHEVDGLCEVGLVR